MARKFAGIREVFDKAGLKDHRYSNRMTAFLFTEMYDRLDDSIDVDREEFDTCLLGIEHDFGVYLDRLNEAVNKLFEGEA